MWESDRETNRLLWVFKDSRSQTQGVSPKTRWSNEDLFALLTRPKLLNQLKPSHSRQPYRRPAVARRQCGGGGGGRGDHKKRKWAEEGRLKGSRTVGKTNVAELPKGGVDTRGQTRSQNIKANRKFPDKLTGVYLNECSSL